MSKNQRTKPLLPMLQATAERLSQGFSVISEGRKKMLHQLTEFVEERAESKQNIYINFICTHNSRRSLFSQLWAQAAAHYFGIPNVESFSGGTEATTFNPRAVKAMREAGFTIIAVKPGENQVYEVRFAEDIAPVTAFSKKYDDPFNPNKDFAAVMTCSQADENCPLVIGATARIILRYDDPKEFDNTPQEAAKYKERVEQIGTEILYAFSRVHCG